MALRIDNPAAMEDLGRRLASCSVPGLRIHLQGELGAGKTTLVRGFLRGCGHRGNVKSPTYTLVEPYAIENRRIYHFDLYRISDPEELEAIGLRDYLDGVSECLVEWPERAATVLPAPDLVVIIAIDGDGREVAIRPQTARGRRVAGSVKQVDVS